MIRSILILFFASCAATVVHPTLHGTDWAAEYDQYTADCGEPDPGGATPTPDQLALEVMCSGHGYHAVAIDVVPDPVDAASEVLETLREGLSTLDCATRACEKVLDEPTLAWAADLSDRVSPEAVAAELAKGTLPTYMQHDLLARYRAARAYVAALVSAQGAHWRAVYLDRARAARSQRVATDAALASWRDRAAVLVHDADTEVLAAHVDPSLVGDALALRRDYVAACLPLRASVEACAADAVGGALTRAIDRMARSRDDEPLVEAESALQQLSDRADPRTDERIAAQAAFDAEIAQRHAYEGARAAGITADVISARWPEPPLVITSSPVIGVDLVHSVVEPRGNASSYDGCTTKSCELTAEVHSITAQPVGAATVVFPENIEHSTVPTGCHETDKVDAIDANGQYIYRVACTGPLEQVSNDKTIAPVVVPAAEVAMVQPGDMIRVAIDRTTRDGHVVSVTRGAVLVQLHDLLR